MFQIIAQRKNNNNITPITNIFPRVISLTCLPKHDKHSKLQWNACTNSKSFTDRILWMKRSSGYTSCSLVDDMRCESSFCNEIYCRFIEFDTLDTIKSNIYHHVYTSGNGNNQFYDIYVLQWFTRLAMNCLKILETINSMVYVLHNAMFRAHTECDFSFSKRD